MLKSCHYFSHWMGENGARWHTFYSSKGSFVFESQFLCRQTIHDFILYFISFIFFLNASLVCYCIAHYSNVIKYITRCLQHVKYFKLVHGPLNKLSNASLGKAWLFILLVWESLLLMKLGLKPLWTVNTFSFDLYLFNERLYAAVLVITPLSPSNTLNTKSQSRGHTQC